MTGQVRLAAAGALLAAAAAQPTIIFELGFVCGKNKVIDYTAAAPACR